MANHQALTAEQVREMRGLLGESQAVFGERFGVDQSSVSLWEQHGAPKRGSARIMLEQLRERLGADIERRKPRAGAGA